MKRFLKYLITFLIIGAVGLSIYLSWSYISNFLNKTPAPAQTGALPKNIGGLPTATTAAAATEIIQAISKNPAFAYWMNATGSEIFYIKNDGQIIKINNQDNSKIIQETVTSQQPIDSLHSVLANKINSKVIIAYGLASNRQWTIYDPSANAWTPLPKGVTAAAWSPDATQIAYFKDNGDLMIRTLRSGLSTSSGNNGTGNKETKLINLNQTDNILLWSKPSQIEIISRPSNYAGGSWVTLDIKTLKLDVKRSGVAGLSLLLDNANKLGLELNSVNFNSLLQIINENGLVLQVLSFVTLPEKCAFGDQTLFCAIPRSPEPKIRLPDYYLQDGAYAVDDIYRFDLKSGEVKAILSADEKTIDAWDMKTLGNKLFFINRFDKLVYQLLF